MIQLLAFIVAFSLVAVIAEYFKVIDKLKQIKQWIQITFQKNN